MERVLQYFYFERQDFLKSKNKKNNAEYNMTLTFKDEVSDV